MSIHDIDMNSIGAGLLRFSDLLSQAGKVCRED
jgi:hypothetical protein